MVNDLAPPPRAPHGAGRAALESQKQGARAATNLTGNLTRAATRTTTLARHYPFAISAEGAGTALRRAADIILTARGEMTTAELISCERRLIASAIGRGSEGTGVVDSTRVDRALAAADRPLNAEQTTPCAWSSATATA